MEARYREEARKHGLSAASTMDDETIRHRELAMILEHLEGHTILDVGCGNGYTISELHKVFHDKFFTGIDASREMIELCESRRLTQNVFFDLRNIADFQCMPTLSDVFDFVYSERCLTNLENWGEQWAAIQQIHRILKPKGKFLLIECFTDGLENLNRARKECGLPVLKSKPWNHYIDKDVFVGAVGQLFNLLPCQSNFLSSHYFVSRVLHALVTKGKQIKNTEFVKFFSYLPPMGNYSPLQAFLLEKK